jgi:hypothetical protein
MLRQQTLTFAQSGRVAANRPGPRPKASTPPLTPTVSAAIVNGIRRRRRKIGGISEAKVIVAFSSSRAHYKAGEPDSDSSVDSEDEGNQVYKKRTRQSYSREKKL